MTSSQENLISARTQFWDAHTSCSISAYALWEFQTATSMVTARVTDSCRTDHRIRGTLKFPYFGPLLALGLSKRGYRSNVNKAARQN